VQGKGDQNKNNDDQDNGNQYKKGIFIIFFMNFYVFFVTPNHANNKGNYKKRRKN